MGETTSSRGTFTRPVHGSAYQKVAVNKAVDRTQFAAQIAAYRLFLHDAIPFRRHIHVSIEHGGTDADPGAANENVWTFAFYYLQSARAGKTDTLDVGNITSEKAHGYEIATPTWKGIQIFKFEGVHNTDAVTDDGRAHTGTSKFTMKVAPTNTGVLLRRRFDQGIGRQRARVFVDGDFVGEWYFAGMNSTFRWREEDFLIPAAHTHGKSSITVMLKFKSSDVDWNEFTYWVHSLT